MCVFGRENVVACATIPRGHINHFPVLSGCPPPLKRLMPNFFAPTQYTHTHTHTRRRGLSKFHELVMHYTPTHIYIRHIPSVKYKAPRNTGLRKRSKHFVLIACAVPNGFSNFAITRDRSRRTREDTRFQDGVVTTRHTPSRRSVTSK